MIVLAEDGLPDDRITCRECALARDHAGGRLQCSVFRGDMIPDLRRRCVKFIPLRSSSDHRSGLERWPHIQEQIEEIRRMDREHANRKVSA